MKKLKIAAILAAALMLITACGADTRVAATIDGAEIPAGVYIYKEMVAYYDAYSLKSEADAAAAASPETAAATTTPLLESTIEGIPARQWISDETLKTVREYAAINAKFTEFGLSYSLDAYGMPMDQLIKESIDRSWDENDSPMLYPFGISKASYEQVQLNSQKYYELFNYYYGENGSRRPAEDEIKKYLTDHFARINYIEMDLRDAEGNLLKSDGKAERKKMAEEYLARAKSGEDFNDVLAEYTDWYDTLTGAAATATVDVTGTTEVTNPEDEVPPNNEIVIDKENSYTPSTEVIEKAFELQAADPALTTPQYFIVEAINGEKYWVVELKDLFSDPSYYDLSKEAAVTELKTPEFEDLIDLWTREQNVVINEKAVERYKPDMFEDE
jgi:hypothetical protein